MSETAEFARLLACVAQHFYGEPTQTTKRELRFRTRGSLAIDLTKAAWYDHEAGEGGGAIDLIKRETGITEPRDCYTWAEQQGYWSNGHAKPITNNSKRPGAKLGKEVDHYPYVDETGAMLSQVVRFDPKDFRQRKPDGAGGWNYKLGNVRRVPYRLPELIEALANEYLIVIVEGEKDVENLRALGVPTTTNCGGANKWHSDLNRFFAGADVVVVADNDPQATDKNGKPLFHPDGRPKLPGQDHAQDVAQHLYGIAQRVRVVDLGKHWPECPPKGDISDWIEAGHTVEQLWEIVGRIPHYMPGGDYHDEAPPWEPPPTSTRSQGVIPRFVSQSDFLAGFVPPDYLVDGVLQRRFIYLLTGRTSGGKTAIGLELMRAVACVDVNATFGGHLVEKGHVVYFVGENPDDVRARVIGANARRDDDPTLDRISFVVGVFNIDEMYARLAVEAERVGGVDLVIIDTSAAYFLTDDENNNSQMGAHARSLRRLTELPGGPCVLALCHPVKYVNDPSQLLPRGGGAFVAEMDGNLTAWKHDDDLVDLHHTDKLRGPGFEPITFKIEKFTTPKLVDAKGRAIPTLRVVSISEAEQAEQARNIRRDEDKLLVELLKNADRSWADLARACGFVLDNGEPYKSKVRRIADELQSNKLLKKTRGQRWTLTDQGRKAAEKLNDKARADVADKMADKIAERGGATYTNKEFVLRKGRKMDDAIRCVFCQKRGGVYKIADGRLPKGTRGDPLHERCAKDWYAGAPQPPDDGPSEPDIFDAKPDQDFEGDIGRTKRG